jgi:hypothetical protein
VSFQGRHHGGLLWNGMTLPTNEEDNA